LPGLRRCRAGAPGPVRRVRHAAALGAAHGPDRAAAGDRPGRRRLRLLTPPGPLAAALQVPPRLRRRPPAGAIDARRLRERAATGRAAADPAAPGATAPAGLRPGAGTGEAARARPGAAVALRPATTRARDRAAIGTRCRG